MRAKKLVTIRSQERKEPYLRGPLSFSVTSFPAALSVSCLLLLSSLPSLLYSVIALAQHATRLPAL